MNISKNVRIFLIAVSAILVTCGIGMKDNLFKSNAASNTLSDISTLKNAEKITSNTKIPADYTFFPKIQKNADGTQLTKVETFGDWDSEDTDVVNDTTLKKDEGIANIVWIDKGDHSYDGKIGAIYDNVGTYNGHTIKLKVTYMGNSDNATDNGFGLILYNNSLAIRTSASPYATKIKYEFFDSQTNEKINVKGYQSFTDIDAHQGIKIDNYDKIYYTDAASKNFKIANYETGLENLIQSTIDNISDDQDGQAKIAYTFSGSEITFTWTSSNCYYKNVEPDNSFKIARCFVDKDRDECIQQTLDTYYYTDKPGKDGKVCSADTPGAVRNFAVLVMRANSTKMLPSEIKNPIKQISDETGDKSNITEYSKDSKIYFSVLHDVPGEIADNYYKSYYFSDKLEPGFIVNTSDVKIYNDTTDVDVTSNFTITATKDNNDSYTVKAVLKDPSDKNFYANSYNMVIGTTVDKNADLSDYLEDDGSYHIPNTAIVSVNGKDYDSNKVTVIVNDDPSLLVEKKSDKTVYNVGDTATYTVKVTQDTKKAIAKNVVIKDTLDNSNVAIIKDSLSIKKNNGQDVQNANITVNKNNYTIETNDNLATDEYYTITYKVSLVNETIAGEKIQNTVIASSDNTNDVEDDTTIEILKPVKPVLKIEKNVNKINFLVGETAHYTVKVSQTEAGATAKNVIISDEFDKNLVKATNINIVNNKGIELKNVNTSSTPNGFTINTNSNLRENEYFLVSYDVVLSNSDLADTSLNNIATASADDIEDVQDNVKINISAPALDIEKKVMKTHYTIGDKATYTLKVKQTVANAIAKNVVITDEFDTDAVKATDFKITGPDGNELKDYKIDDTENGFSIKTNTNLKTDEYITVVYNVSLTDNSLVNTTINNTAKAKADNTDEVKDNATITVVAPKLSIKKEVNKTAFSTNDKATYTLTVKQTVTNAVAKNVVITDTLNTNLTKSENVKITDKNGKEINGVEILETENGFKINTHANLESDDFFTVTYTVSLSNAQLSGKDIKNVATATSDNTDQVEDTKTITVSQPELSIVKKSDKKVYSTGETAKYTLEVSQNVENAIAKNVVIKDSFNNENISKPSSIKITDSKGNELDNYEVKVNDTGFVIYTNTNLKYGEKFIVTYNVAMASGKLSGKEIVNTATANSDNTPETSTDNTVTVTTPKLAIDKTVNKKAFSSNETAKYTLKITQTEENAIAKNVIINDTFDNENISQPKNIKVMDSNGEEIENVNIDTSATGFRIETNKDLKYNESITVTYNVGLTSPALVGKTITNIADASADNAEKVEDNVSITVGKPSLSVIKESNKSLYGTDENAKYTITVKQTVKNATAQNVVIKDVFNNKNVSVMTDTIKVFDKNGKLLRTADVEKTATGYIIKTYTDLNYNESLKITYTANFMNDKLAGKTIKNTVTASSDNTPDKSDEKIVKIVQPVLKIKKVSEKAAYLLGSTAKYQIEVKQTTKNAIAKNVVITDIVNNKNAKLVKDSVVVKDTKGKDVSNVKILTAENGFQIQTNSNLAYKEKFVITYNMNFKDVKLNNKNIKNTATATSDTTKYVKDKNVVKVSNDKSVVEKVNRLDKKDRSIIQTGNNLPIKLFGIIAVVSICGIGVSVILRKRQ